MDSIKECFKNILSFAYSSSRSSNQADNNMIIDKVPKSWEKSSFWIKLPKPLQSYDRIRMKGKLKGSVKG